MQDGGREKSVTLLDAYLTSFLAVLQVEGAGAVPRPWFGQAQRLTRSSRLLHMELQFLVQGHLLPAHKHSLS